MRPHPQRRGVEDGAERPCGGAVVHAHLVRGFGDAREEVGDDRLGAGRGAGAEGDGPRPLRDAGGGHHAGGAAGPEDERVAVAQGDAAGEESLGVGVVAAAPVDGVDRAAGGGGGIELAEERNDRLLVRDRAVEAVVRGQQRRQGARDVRRIDVVERVRAVDAGDLQDAPVDDGREAVAEGVSDEAEAFHGRPPPGGFRRRPSGIEARKSEACLSSARSAASSPVATRSRTRWSRAM